MENIGNITPRIKLSPLQSRVFKAWLNPQYRVISCCFGRRSGKTILNAAIIRHAAFWDILPDGTQKPAKKKNIWYVTDTREHAEDLIWAELKSIFTPKQISKIRNDALTIELANGSKVKLKSADNPDALRGASLDLLCIDEAAMVSYQAYQTAMPTLADRRGRLLITSTPRGMDNWFYTVFERANEQEPIRNATGRITGWKPKYPFNISFKATTAEAGIVSLEEIERQKAEMDEKTFREEFLATFENSGGRVYYAFHPTENVTDEAVDDGESDIYVGMDFNVDPICAAIGRREGRNLIIFDEIMIKDSNTHEISMELVSRYPDRNIIVCPDASGQRRDTRSIKQDTSDHSILREYGFHVRADRKNPAIIDRVNSLNSLLQSKDGERRLLIHPDCKQVINSLNRQGYKAGTRLPDKKGGWDHMTDALGYLVYQLFPVNPQRRGKVGIKRLELV